MAVSKKEARKQKSATDLKAPAAAPSKSPKSAKKDKKTKEVEVSEDELDSDEDDEEEISEEGMKRLMELVDVNDLNEEELAMLGAGGDSEDEEDDEDYEDAEDDEMLSGESDSEDEEEKEQDNTIVNEQPDEDAISLDGLGSDVSVDEDAVPRQKITINNKPALRLLTEQLKVTNMPWPEHLVLNSKEVADVDPSDDLSRETVFYKIALSVVPQAKKLAAKHDIPFSRPGDYYAEMVKSDEHMERIRTKLVEEASGIKKSEAAKKQRDLKKFGKQIQHDKLRQREQEKKSFDEKVAGLKRKRKEGAEIGDDDGQFDIDVEDVIEGRDDKGGRSSSGKSKMPRSVRDNKYSMGGGGKRSKQNTKESSMDFGGGSSSRGGGAGRGGRGGRGGSAGRGGGRGGSAGGAKRGGRPGKSKRSRG
ncbi:hypothetical protein L202_02042 [Cryptococcus amylolentus CBS 6039]|uniref:rRNA-processing protein EBP2 n=1 Tax=Cryptococcus amylolentus CBS 6039 TaxID=1295533 RepID=A0A1E3HZI5_9TREE|nr:hypothetical protein L202_02042 [Cryptococcus amylolentus CBS 6039]ODN81638.1 hypothetical protein L202_02042 [Cryptococcus amylolentus CBS 6039]